MVATLHSLSSRPFESRSFLDFDDFRRSIIAAPPTRIKAPKAPGARSHTPSSVEKREAPSVGRGVVIGTGVVAVEVSVDVAELVGVEVCDVVSVTVGVVLAVVSTVLVSVDVGVVVAVVPTVLVSVDVCVLVIVVVAVLVSVVVCVLVIVVVAVVACRHPIPSAWPSPSNPSLHVHVYDPSVSVHTASVSHGS